MKPKSLLDRMTFSQLESMSYESGEVGDYWFIRCGDDICIHEQKMGERSRQDIRIPVAVMRRIVARLTKQQTPRKARAKS